MEGLFCFVSFLYLAPLCTYWVVWRDTGKKSRRRKLASYYSLKFSSILPQHNSLQKFSPGILQTLLLLVLKWMRLFDWYWSNWTSSHHSAQEVEKYDFFSPIYREWAHIAMHKRKLPVWKFPFVVSNGVIQASSFCGVWKYFIL